jgi:hypothetical protein
MRGNGMELFRSVMNVVVIVFAILYFLTIFFQDKISKKVDMVLRIVYSVTMLVFIISLLL